MRFIDEATVHVISGRGGDGCMSFHRERFVTRGGPDGGDGGRGGDVVLRATTRRNTLVELRGHAVWRAKSGAAGGARRCTGKSAESIYIDVPVGTRIFDDETGEVICDLLEDGQEEVVAAGGRGGLGNWHFKSSTNRSPRRIVPGSDGEERRLRLELILMADIGLLGFPNAGKSTLMSRISAARPRVADYPFTTLVPSLGVVDMGDDGTFVIADIPGLVAGAAEGVGLGHRFLKHLSRTRALLHLVSLSELDEQALEVPAAERYQALREELVRYDEDLAQRPEIVVLTKCDLVDDERLAQVRAELAEVVPHDSVLVVSSATGAGLPALKAHCFQLVRAMLDE